jgi:hypothetical protein
MPDPNPSPSQVSDALWDRLEQVLQRFEEAWRTGRPPDLNDYLPVSPPERRRLLPELVHEDLEYRLRAGEAARVEPYLQRFPELAADRDAVLSLIAWEYQVRRRREPGLSAEEYLRRFPAHQAELRARLSGAPRARRSAPRLRRPPPRSARSPPWSRRCAAVRSSGPGRPRN